MRLHENFANAFRGLVSHKTRSFLTMLGIIIGISSVIMMMSLGKGAEGLILGQLDQLGPNALFIRSGGGSPNGPPNFAQFQAIKYPDYEAVAKLPSVRLAAPIVMVDATLSYDGQNTVPQVYGTTSEYFELNHLDVGEGRFFDETDLESAANVVVLGYQVQKDLFGDDTDVVGRTINVKRKNFTVIGTMPYRGSSFIDDQDKSAFIPITTAMNEISGADYLNFMMVEAKDSPDFAAEDIRFLLRDRHQIDNPTGDETKDDFLVMTQAQAASTFGAVTGALTIFLSAIASISLIVGGIGIMNIMLVSVTERTREIGLRKAVGATRGNILTQFLLEAVMLTTLGGAIGIAIGVGFSFLASKIIANFSPDWVFAVPMNAIVLAFGTASAVGLVFGLYPAQKASKLDPIEALRYE